MDRLVRDNNHKNRFFVFSGIIVVIVLLLECSSIPGTSGFLLPPQSDSYHRATTTHDTLIRTSTTTATGNRRNHQPPHPRFVASTTELYGGIFGLGVPELLIIGIAGGVLIGPEKLGKYIGDVTGKLQSEGIPDEFKQIPKEFQKGFEESTTNAKARNAKPMEPIAQPTKKKTSTSSSLPVSPRTMPTQPSSADDDPN